MTGAYRIYRDNWLLFLTIGLAAVPIGFLFDGLAWVLQQTQPGNWLVEWFNSPSQTSLASLFLATSFQYLTILLFVVPASVAATAKVMRKQPTSAELCYRTVLRRIKPILICLVLLSLVTGFLVSSFIGIADRGLHPGPLAVLSPGCTGQRSAHLERRARLEPRGSAASLGADPAKHHRLSGDRHRAWSDRRVPVDGLAPSVARHRQPDQRPHIRGHGAAGYHRPDSLLY